MFVYACKYALGLNERYIMCTYVAYIQEQHWQQQTEREMDDKAQGIVPYLFFLLNKAIWKKQDHSLQNSIWVKIKNIILILNFDIVLKSVVGMQ